MRYVTLLALALFLIGCAPKDPIHNTQSYVFGTLVDITIYGESENKSQAISNDIIHIFQNLHNRLHAWQPSEITTLNKSFSQSKLPIFVKADVVRIITDATKLSLKSKGAFNPAIGGLIGAWGFQKDEFKPTRVDETVIKKWVNANPKMTDIVIKNNQVFSTNPSVQLDLGGYAKGYALDIALAYLQKKGIKNALINIGGNIIALGKHGDKPWRVGIQNPRKPAAIASLDLPSGWAIGTSGDYQRYFELDGKRYCHIINPATGYPVQNVQAVTVLIPPQINSGVLSDVSSKPIFIATPETRPATALIMGVQNFLVIESEKNIQVSPEMAKRITWLDNDASKHAMITKY
jgi:thiamine biosynthesis lipoprotein